MKNLHYFAAILLFLSCSNKEKFSPGPNETNPAYPAPVTVLLDTVPSAKKVELKNVPPPRVIAVPTTIGGSYKGFTAKGEENIKLLPPVVTKASMPVAHFTNFNTEDGLALVSIRCGLMDKKGRLWFGTPGGGVSCYDGTGFTTFNTGQGLTHSAVLCMAEDKKGHLWFGTFGGVNHYDGTRFTNYTTREGLADNQVFNIVCDKKGNLWFATYQHGVSRYDGTKFTTIDTSNGLPSDFISMIAEDTRENLWLVSGGDGVFRYDAGRPAPARSSSGLLANEVGNDTVGWGKNFKTFTTADGLPTNNMMSVFADSKGNLWFGSSENGVTRYDGKKFTTIMTGNTPAKNTVNGIAEDKDGNLWFATSGTGVIRYVARLPAHVGTDENDSLGQRNDFTTFTAEQGLGSNTVNNITKDQHGNLWFGTEGGGLSRYNGNTFNVFTTKQGLPENNVTSIAEDRAGNLWLGTNGDGIIRYDGKYFTRYTTEQGMPSNNVSSIFQDKSGNLWLGTTGGGVSRFDGKSFTTFTTEQGLANNQVATIAQDKDGNIWIGTYGGGVSRYDGMEFATFTTEQGMAHDFVICIAQDKSENLWFGTAAGGVSLFDGKQFTNFTSEHGLADNCVLDIKKDKNGNLWFGTPGGVSRYDGFGFLNFNSSHGLPEDNVCNITEDEQGVIWLGTYQGFCSLKFKAPIPGNEPGELKGAGLFNISNEELKTYEPVCVVYNEKTGYPVKDLIDASMITKKREFPKGNKRDVGVIWAPTGDIKLIRFDPKSVVTNSEPLSIFIKSVRIDEQPVNWYGLQKTKNDSVLMAQQEAMVFGNSLPSQVRDSLQRRFGDIQIDSITPFYQLPLNLVLPYHHNRVSFDFGAIETNRNFMVRYQYILEGYDKEWSPMTEKKSVAYGNIAQGGYTFRLKARSPEGVWSEPIEYHFRVLPPWWRTWWAYSIYGLLLVITIWGFTQYRFRNLLKEKTVLEQKVSQRTAEVVLQKEEIAIQRDHLEKTLGELKTTQNQLIHSAKMASLGELTAGIAHEIQNPLNFVNNFSDVNAELIEEAGQEINNGNMEEVKILLRDIKDNEQKINHHGKRAGTIVKGMLQHSRTRSDVKEPTDINALAEEYLRLSYHNFQVRDDSPPPEGTDRSSGDGFHTNLKTDFGDIGKVNVNPQDLGRVFLNLFNNAFYAVHKKFLDTGSPAVKKKSLETGNDYEPTVSVITKKQGDNILITVKDNGIGIPQHLLDKIFQPFFTTKPTGQGTGLGLSLSYDIIKAHGGSISVVSNYNEPGIITVNSFNSQQGGPPGGEIQVVSIENQGSEFTVQIPVD